VSLADGNVAAPGVLRVRQVIGNAVKPGTGQGCPVWVRIITSLQRRKAGVRGGSK